MASRAQARNQLDHIGLGLQGANLSQEGLPLGGEQANKVLAVH